MSSSEDLDRTPLLEESHGPWQYQLIFSRTQITVMAVIMQGVICSLIWAFAGVLIVRKAVLLPGNLAGWVYRNQSETNFLATMASTTLGVTGSFLLGITVQHALTFRLPRGVRLLTLTAWIQLTRNALFFQPRRHVLWTILSVLWVTTIHSLTTVWSNLLTPEIFVQNYTSAGQGLDLLKPAVSELLSNFSFPFIPPTSRNYSLTPADFAMFSNFSSFFSQAGSSAIAQSYNGYPSFIGQFNSSTGGVDLLALQHQLSGFPDLHENFQEVSAQYTLVQQGFTTNISCRTSSSPAIILNNSASVAHTFETPSGPFEYALETWSWSTNCSGNGAYNAGEINLLTSNDNFTGNGLFATLVCFYQNFSGPSNQSFLFLMRSPMNSGYSNSYLAANPNLTTVCEFTPMVTTVEVQYNSSGTANISRVLQQTPLPDYSWPLLSIEGFFIWGSYFFAQGPYSNSFADVPLIFSFQSDIDPSLHLAQYQRGIFEYIGSFIRYSISFVPFFLGETLPENMTTQISGIMSVQTVGWRFHPRTHSIALGVITLVTVVTTASGIFAFLEANNQKMVRDALERGDAAAFDPTSLMDVLSASSKGSLANTMSGCEEREKLTAGLAVTDGGQPVLNALADVAEDAIPLKGGA